jgi:hypothetical protein
LDGPEVLVSIGPRAGWADCGVVDAVRIEESISTG